jgi:hypothetical protein
MQIEKSDGEDGAADDDENEDKVGDKSVVPSKVNAAGAFSERIQYHTTFHFSKKTRSFSFYSTIVKGRRAYNYFAVNYHNNNAELYSFEPNA